MPIFLNLTKVNIDCNNVFKSVNQHKIINDKQIYYVVFHFCLNAKVEQKIKPVEK